MKPANSRVPLVYRAGLALAVLAVAIGLITWSRSASRRASLVRSEAGLVTVAPPRGEDWCRAFTAGWQDRKFVGLGDRAALAGVVRAIVANRSEGAFVRNEDVVRDVGATLYALAASSAAEYLERSADLRILRDTAAGSALIQTAYRATFGDSIPAGTNQRALIDRFWSVVPSSIGRPAQVCADGGAFFAIEVPTKSPQAFPPGTWVYGQLMPSLPERAASARAEFVGPFSQALIPLTSARIAFDAVLRAHAKVTLAHFVCVIQTEGGYVFPLTLGLYRDTTSGVWFTESMWCVCPYQLAWCF